MTSNWNDANTVNGGGWTDVPVKSTQTSALNNEKWSVGRKTLGHKNRDNTTWKQESEGNRSVVYDPALMSFITVIGCIRGFLSFR